MVSAAAALLLILLRVVVLWDIRNDLSVRNNLNYPTTNRRLKNRKGTGRAIYIGGKRKKAWAVMIPLRVVGPASPDLGIGVGATARRQIFLCLFAFSFLLSAISFVHSYLTPPCTFLFLPSVIPS